MLKSMSIATSRASRTLPLVSSAVRCPTRPLSIAAAACAAPHHQQFRVRVHQPRAIHHHHLTPTPPGRFAFAAATIITTLNSTISTARTVRTSISTGTTTQKRQLSKMAATKDYRLVCLENPLLDIQAVGDQALLDKYGLKANDAILAEDKHQGIFEDLLTNFDAKLLPGGAAQNTARGAQYILPPNSVVFLGGTGDDKYAAILRDGAQKAGLRVEYRVDPKVATGRCGVVITGHNRSMCTELGAANHYDLEHLKRPDVWALVENAEVYYVGGYHFTVCPPAIMELCNLAATRNKPFVLSLSAPFIAQFFKEPLDATAPYWDYIIGNETEAAAYAESHGLGVSPTDVKAIATALANLPKANSQRKRVAIVTQGTEPTVVAVQGEQGVKEFPVHAIAKEEINDTTGAGDAFAGGLCAGIVEGRPLDECIDMGQWLARLSIKELGPSYPFPKQTYQPSKN